MPEKKRRRPKDELAPQDPATLQAPTPAPLHEPVTPWVPIVGIGASAGGLEAFTRFFRAMPDHTGIAFILVMHLDPTHENMTPELLAKHTPMRVAQAADGMPIQPDHVYIIPPSKQLTVEEGVLHLSRPVERRGLRVPIDRFFQSLAQDQGERAIAIILSGTGSDGTQGIKEIKAKGGLVLVQAPADAKHDGMPRGAIGTGMADHVLTVDKMPDFLLRYVRHPYMHAQAEDHAATLLAGNELHLRDILVLLRLKTGNDFRPYKTAPLARRIQRRMSLAQIDSLDAYHEHLREDPLEARALLKDILIGVTSFFRDAPAWKTLEDEVIPEIVARKQNDEPIRVWTPGCSLGQEAYGLAILFLEALEKTRRRCPIQVFATDIDLDSLDEARRGIYPEEIAEEISPERLRRFFVKHDDAYQVIRPLRDCVTFAPQNLVADPPFSKLDLVSCRNLLIYLEPQSQERVISLFHFALREDGYLFLGSSENLGRRARLFDVISKKWRIYRRIGRGRQPELEHPHEASAPRPAAAIAELPPRQRRLPRIRELEGHARITETPTEQEVATNIADLRDVAPLELEDQLKSARQQLNVTIEELEAANEELKTANQEVMSMNEELQATNEELETVNTQLEAKVEEQEALNDDLRNLLASTQIATIFLDPAFKIKRFTPSARKLFNLIPSDVGRPLDDITHNLADEDILGHAEEVLLDLAPHEEEVQDEHGAWYVRRVTPYRTEDNRIEGVVLTFVDITPRKAMEAELQRHRQHLEQLVSERTEELARANDSLRHEFAEREQAEQTLRALGMELTLAVEGSRGGLWRMDFAPGMAVGALPDRIIISPELKALLGFTDEEIPNSRAVWLGHIFPEDLPRVHKAAEDHLAGRTPVYEIEYRMRHKDGSVRWIYGRGKILRDAAGKPIRWAGIDWDVTPRKSQEEDEHRRRERLEAEVTSRTAELRQEIAERARAEAALRESEERFRTLVANIPGAVYRCSVPPAWRVHFMSEGARALTGCPVSDFEREGGRTWHEIVVPEDLPRVERVIAQGLVEKRPFEIEYRIRHADGSIRWVYDKGQASYDEGGAPSWLHGVIIDATDRKRAELALRESRERWRQLTEHAPVGIFQTDVKGACTFANRRFCELVDMSPESILGKPWTTGIAPEDIEPIKSGWLARAHDAGRFSREYRYETSDGRVTWVYGSIVPLRDGEGEIQGYLGTCIDITERKQVEEQRQKLEQQIQHAQKLESLGVLAGGIAHDFNNLLVAILGNAQIAVDELPTGSTVREPLRDIEMGARRAADLCRQLLAYSGKGRFVIQSLDLGKVVKEMTHLLEVSISKKAELRYNLAPRLPPIEADGTQVQQIVMNLITNASEALGDKAGVITVTTGVMDCDREYLQSCYLDDSLVEGRYAFLEVADTGCGLDEETRTRMFDPFFTTKFTGRGLGLAAVLGIVRGHRAAIRVDSVVGKGTTFRVLFPASSQPPKEIDESEGQGRMLRGSGTVLAVDDEPSVLKVVKRALSTLGLSVLTAASGGEALQLFAQRGNEIGCVLLDLTMPDMDGDELFVALRRIRPDVRVFLMSGYSEQEISRRFLGQGLSGFVQKPFDLQSLRAAVGGALGLGQARN